MNKFRSIIYILIVLGFVGVQFFTAFFLGNLINSLGVFDYDLFIIQSCLVVLLLFALLIFNILKRNYSEKLKYDIVNQKKKNVLRYLVSRPVRLELNVRLSYRSWD